jgi:hypothetical protein
MELVSGAQNSAAGWLYCPGEMGVNGASLVAAIDIQGNIDCIYMLISPNGAYRDKHDENTFALGDEAGAPKDEKSINFNKSGVEKKRTCQFVNAA